MSPAAVQTPPKGATKTEPRLLVPFTRAAREHTETFLDLTQQITANTIALPQADIPAYGFMRHIDILVEATGGVSAVTTAVKEDAPWNALQDIVVKDVNGAPILGPFDGFDAYLISKYGGYSTHSVDPKQRPSYTAPVVGASASGNFAFSLRLPIEISQRDALGALQNQNAASTFKLAMSLAPAATIYSTAPSTTLPTVRIRASLGAWTQPSGADLRGNGQATSPPSVGTTQFWSKAILPIAAGAQVPRLPRVGNYIRELIFVYRDAAGSRSVGEAQFPDPFRVMHDTRLLHEYVRKLFRDQIQRRTDLTAAAEAVRGFDNGVFVQDFCHDFDGQIGQELRDGWLPTTQSTRLEVGGNFGAAGTLVVLTNDVAPFGEIFV